MIYGYVRAVENCSLERDISLNKQVELLRSQGITSIYQDEISIETSGEEQFNMLLENLKCGDIVVVTKLSRISNNFKELFHIYDIFLSKGVQLHVLELGDSIYETTQCSRGDWLKALETFEKDVIYEKRCKGHLISKKTMPQCQ